MSASESKLFPQLSQQQLGWEIERIRADRGDSLLILAHHYQRDDVMSFSDLQGDSFLLSQQAADSSARDIVFLGVHFMAETADLVSKHKQRVFMPDVQAGCAMADMASMEEVTDCWDKIHQRYSGRVIPVTYVNSHAALKDFCGRRGGLTCTSSSAVQAFEHALQEGDRLLFFPDWCLGANTSYKLGIGDDDIARYDRQEGSFCGSDNPRVILWDGYCPVHKAFEAEHIRQFRRTHPAGRVVVHPECPPATVKEADCDGSTEFIRQTVKDAEPGSAWAVGTEINLVQRLNRQHADRSVKVLGSAAGPCEDMMKTDRRKLLRLLRRLQDDDADEFRVTVAPKIAKGARLALQRMLRLGK